MKIILHAGHNKTGSTAVQQTCSRERKTLKRLGLLYPQLPDRIDHSGLLPAILDDDEYLGNFARRSHKQREKGVAESEDAWVRLDKVLANTSCPNVLLSSEFIFGLRPLSLDRLLSRLMRHTDDIESVVYLREPGDHYISSAQQILKWGSEVKDPRTKQSYFQKLTKLKRLVPGKVQPRLFERSKLVGEDVTLDLLSIILPPDQVSATRLTLYSSNRSLSAEAMVLLRRFNAEAWGDRRIVGNPINKIVLSVIEKEEGKRDYTKAVLHSEIRDIVTRAHQDDLTQLRDQFGLEFSRFDYDLGPSEGERTPTQEKLEAGQGLEVGDIVGFDPDLEGRLVAQVILHLARATAEERKWPRLWHILKNRKLR